MCALKVHIKSSIFENIFLRIEKVINTFSIPEKIFSKMINYCVPLGHTLAKSVYYYNNNDNMLIKLYIKVY